ncbi:MAG: NADH-ubiquinone oxidoreductase-F iron-sulfur binding region domain-containing protein [Candidatus Limnocylindrales bacterium]|jgi:NADH:ubiquinone oxidoreductase subunit F (NADH-binding)
MTSTAILATPARFPRLLLPATPTADPLDLDAAVAAGAFGALRLAVEKLKADGVINALTESGMRGRGSGGHAIGEKWRACARAGIPAGAGAAPGTVAPTRYVVVNAYGADPAVMTDRVLLESNPYAAIEGAAIAAFAVGAREVIVALRAEAAGAIRAVEAAVAAAESAGYLGENVLDSGAEIRFSVRPLQGSYMLGEETVLLKGLEGKRGQPEQQPPYTTTRGLNGAPTLIHGPQTFASVPTILSGGIAGFAETDARTFAGTILVQISGAVAHPGVAEVPFGVTLREVLDVAGGVPGPRRLKAVLVGGPSGGILPAGELGVGFDHDSLEKAGAHVGSGSIVVLDQHSCVVDLAAVLTRFCADEACGKTIPCRIGLRRLAEIGARICEGQPRGDEIARLTDLSVDIVGSALCDHERRATLALLSVVRYFRDELDAHLLRNTCPAGICQPKADARAGAVS